MKNLPEELGAAYDAADAGATLDDAAEHARHRYEGLADVGPAFAAHVAACLTSSVGGEPPQLSALCLEDLYLASACIAGAPGAMSAFEREHFAQLDAILHHSSVSLDRDEFRQIMRARLFVGEHDRVPGITTYRGRGNLRAWLRVVATRWLIDRSRKADPDRHRVDDQHLDERAAEAVDNPEVTILKARYRVDFRQLFAAAVDALAPRQRNLLRLRYLRGLGVDEIAVIHGQHRVTVSRALSKARGAILDHLRAGFAELEGDANAVNEVLELISSRLEISLERLLATHG